MGGNRQPRVPSSTKEGLTPLQGLLRGVQAAAGLMVGAMALTGCATGNPGGLSTAETTPVPESTAPAIPTPESNPAPENNDAPPIRECSGPIAAEARTVIQAQIDEFGNGKFKRARNYASDDFQSNIPLKDFREIIKEDYPFLLENPTTSFNGCIERDGKAYVQASLTTDTVTVLTYRLVRDSDGGLGIDAATISAVSMDAEA